MDDQASSGSTIRGDGVTVKECQNMIQRSLRTPMVKFLKQHLEKAGCKISDNFIKAVNCDKQISGGYLRGEGIMVCSNYTNLQDEVDQVVIHELIHAYDECRAANLDWTNCAHHACSEIRAGHLSGDCHYKREFLRGFMKLRGHEQECVRRRVMKSVVANPYCSEAAAKDAMEAVWDAADMSISGIKKIMIMLWIFCQYLQIFCASSPGVDGLWDEREQKKRAGHPAFGWLAEDYSVPQGRIPVHNGFKP